jgi:FdhD protein
MLSDEARPATSTVPALNERGEDVPTPVAGEHPLTLYLDKRELVTLMTLGGAPEHLALGYLRNQRIIGDIATLARVQVDWEVGAVAITSRCLADTGVTLWEAGAEAGAGAALTDRLAHRTVTTGCGQGTVFGDLMADIDSIRLDPDMRLSAETLYGVMDLVRRHESIYKLAGAVHGCALCVAGGSDSDGAPRILRFVEDVGRHNAVDAIAGWMWTTATEGRDKIFYTTGRLTSEMVIKCAQMEIPVLLSRSGLTEMGHRIAERVGITMIGRCQGKHYLLFTGRERFLGAGTP